MITLCAWLCYCVAETFFIEHDEFNKLMGAKIASDLKGGSKVQQAVGVEAPDDTLNGAKQREEP